MKKFAAQILNADGTHTFDGVTVTNVAGHITVECNGKKDSFDMSDLFEEYQHNNKTENRADFLLLADELNTFRSFAYSNQQKDNGIIRPDDIKTNRIKLSYSTNKMKLVLRRDLESKNEAMDLFFELASDFRMNASFGLGAVDAETSDKELLLQYREGKGKFVIRLMKKEF